MDQSIDYELYEVEEISNLPRGTQIAVKGLYEDLHPSLGFFYPLFSEDGFYFHHGVYLGDCKVVHFYGEDKSDAKPRESDILLFLRGAVDGKLYRVEYKNPDMVRSVEETLHHARQTLENPTTWPGFQLLKNNCESFATWLKTGVSRSAQAIQALSNFGLGSRANGANAASGASRGTGGSLASGASRRNDANSTSGASGSLASGASRRNGASRGSLASGASRRNDANSTSGASRGSLASGASRRNGASDSSCRVI